MRVPRRISEELTPALSTGRPPDDGVASTPFMDADGLSALACSTEVETIELSEGGAMVVDLKSGRCWQLNAVGAEAWALLQEGTTLSNVVDALVSRYDVGRAQLAADVRQIVNDLTAQGLIVQGTVPSPR